MGPGGDTGDSHQHQKAACSRLPGPLRGREVGSQDEEPKAPRSWRQWGKAGSGKLEGDDQRREAREI